MLALARLPGGGGRSWLHGVGVAWDHGAARRSRLTHIYLWHLYVINSQAGLVRDRPEGRRTHYCAQLSALAPLIDWTSQMGRQLREAGSTHSKICSRG
jgi:hypothetical protein